MNFLILSILIMGASVAMADEIKPAKLDLICSGTNAEQEIKVVSNENGSVITIKGIEYFGEQLTAGSEGMSPYIQSVNNEAGYNIMLLGEDLDRAFFDSVEIVDAKADAVIELMNEGVQYPASCKGLISF